MKSKRHRTLTIASKFLSMLKHYVKIAFRNIGRNRTFSFLNIFGLALGTACAILIFLWAEDETNYDSFNKRKNVLYQVYQNQTSEGKTFTINATPGPLASGMKEEIPGINNTCRTTWSQALTFSTGDKKMKQEGLYADAAIFNMFTLPFVQGNAKEAFSPRKRFRKRIRSFLRKERRGGSLARRPIVWERA